MKTEYVCRGLISLYVNFHNNQTMWSTNLHVKIGRWGKKKSQDPLSLMVIICATGLDLYKFDNFLIKTSFCSV